MLFEDRDGLHFVYRGLLLAFLYFALELPRRRGAHDPTPGYGGGGRAGVL